MAKAVYDEIGTTYASTRRPDPRIAARIIRALGDATSVVNVGAGAGSYEPNDRTVVAVEPSARMIRQRAASSPPVVQAAAEGLPFGDRTFDAALAVVTLHHWDDWRAGVEEMKRVGRRIVIFTFEPSEVGSFWLTERYLPQIVELDQGRCPPVAELVAQLGSSDEIRVPVPHDCVDGFLAAYWRRPEAYLDPTIRAGMSGLALLDQRVVAQGVARLQSDLESGAWDERFGYLRDLDELDVCYRLVVTR